MYTPRSWAWSAEGAAARRPCRCAVRPSHQTSAAGSGVCLFHGVGMRWRQGVCLFQQGLATSQAIVQINGQERSRPPGGER